GRQRVVPQAPTVPWFAHCCSQHFPTRQSHHEARAEAGRTLHRDLATVLLHVLLHPRETGASPLVCTRHGALHRIESIKDVLELRGGDPRPGVRHLDPRRVIDVTDQSERYLVARFGELERVREQVDDHPFQYVSVVYVHPLPVRYLEDKLDATFGSKRCEE